MADSSFISMTGASNTRQSSRIAKRLKTEPSGTDSGSSHTGGTGTVASARKQQTTTTRTKGSNAKPPPSLLPASLRSIDTSESILSPLEDDFLLNEIFSYVGGFQYVFIGSVNRSFEKLYVSLYPKKTTHFNASTIEYAKSCWDIICKINDDEKKGEEKRKLWHSAARYGKIEVVKYLLELLPPPQKNVLFKNVTYKDRQKIDWMYNLGPTAAKYGQMELLQWACNENICVTKDDDMICHNAITHGHIDMFQWAIKNGFACNDHDMAGYEACKNGQLEALKFLIDNEYDVNVGGGNRDESCGCCNSAACKGQLDVLIWLHENYHTNCCGYTMEFAVASGHVPTVKYLLDNNCGLHDCEGLCNIAAAVGPLAMLQLLSSHDRNIDWDEDAIVEKAAEGGHLDTIEWAIAHGCSLTESACQYAAGFGHLDTLKGLRALDCPWDENTTKYASTNEIYNWAKMNGCPVSKGDPREKLKHSCEYLTDES